LAGLGVRRSIIEIAPPSGAENRGVFACRAATPVAGIVAAGAIHLAENPTTMRRHASRSPAFTLVELLVVIAIIGILVALLLPAIQAAREAARRTQCIDNLKNLALAALNHHDVVKHFPTGGWGWDWVGDADRGFDKDQTGGWMFNLLPFIEEDNEYDRVSDGQPEMLTTQQLDAARSLINHPLPLFGCPSRRGGGRSYAKPYKGKFYGFNVSDGDSDEPEAGRGDYAINCGDPRENEVPAPEGRGPDSLMSALSWRWCTTDSIGTARPPKKCSDDMNGVSFQRSEVALRHITDGASKTYLIGEKFVDALAYETGTNRGDNETWCTGYSNDNYRSAYMPPAQDAPNPDPDGQEDVFFRSPYSDDNYSYEGFRIFGSAHSGGFNMSFCDGHVDTVQYDVDPYVHRGQGARNDAGYFPPRR
jgi:prepilin-type N-terminal cleavage/methylation domain-containing protein/prepilin-type processing-associated H-X9-DG protein